MTQSSTTSLGLGPDGKDVYVPLKDLLPMVNPNDIEFDGTSISSALRTLLLNYIHYFEYRGCIFVSIPIHCLYNTNTLTGWDICNRNIADACREAKVLDVQLQDQLRPSLAEMKPRPSIYCPDFIAANQEDRANNVLTGE